jgi:glycerate-2-kinase
VALGAVKNAVRCVNPERLIKSCLKLKHYELTIYDIKKNKTYLDLRSFDSIYVVGAGKATARMAKAVCQILGDRISGGAINVPYKTSLDIEGICVTEASHPIPDRSGIIGTKKIVEILKSTISSDLVLVLISGGGSSLMPLPSKNLTLDDKQTITDLLIRSGASIQEVNIVRKHLSSIKGGQLIRFTKKGCRVVSLIISDVVCNKLDVIASGPTTPDSSTFVDAAKILKKYRLWNKQNQHVKNIINLGLNSKHLETPKPGDKLFERVSNILIGNNDVACRGALNYLEKRGVMCEKLGTSFDGEAKYFGRNLAKLSSSIHVGCLPFAYILGGETIVKMNKMKKYGVGGRNQEAILSAAINGNFRNDQDVAIVCVGTDGIDGNSEAAGAFLTPQVISTIRQKHLKPLYFLKNHDSFNFFKEIGSLIITGRTGTNVNDIAIVCRTK